MKIKIYRFKIEIRKKFRNFIKKVHRGKYYATGKVISLLIKETYTVKVSATIMLTDKNIKINANTI
jgi:hypothetical protein